MKVASFDAAKSGMLIAEITNVIQKERRQYAVQRADRVGCRGFVTR
jgi:D-alanine-D-alanine ligase-like ATP-grasp enzyme